MEFYNCPNDLKSLGIRVLTSEACGLAMRVLCDLDEDGIELWEKFTRSKVVSEPWNEGKGSIMIPNSMFQDLWIFGQVLKGRRYVFLGDHVWMDQWKKETYRIGDSEETVMSPNETWKPRACAVDSEEEMARIREAIASNGFYIRRFFTKSKHPGTGIDNQHAMSGRIE